MSDTHPTEAPAPLSREALAGLSGLDALRGMLARRLPAPPFSRTTRIVMVEAEHGRVVFEGEPSADFFNPLGTVHGGWTAAMLDSAMACAVHSALAPGQSYTTLEMKVNFVRAVMPALGRVRCEGRLLHLGGRVATSEGRVIDAEGRLIAHGTETCLILAPRAEAAAGPAVSPA